MSQLNQFYFNSFYQFWEWLRGETDENIRPDDKSGIKNNEILPILWSFSPAQFRGKNNQPFTFKYLANVETTVLDGTDV